MILKNKLKEEPGFQYVVDNLDLMSGVGRHRLLAQPWLTNADELDRELDRVEQMLHLLQQEDNSRNIVVIRHKLMGLHDIATSLGNLKGGFLLNEIELFEIKHLSLLYAEASRAAKEIGVSALLPLDLSDIFDLLDPDHTGIANFYVYDSYDPRLAALRKALKADPDNTDLFAQQEEVQNAVVERLSLQLQPAADRLLAALDQMAYLDVLLAKASQALQWGLTRPEIASQDDSIQFTTLFNPRLRHHKEEQGLRYQPVDIALQAGVCLVTGANMAGKTVLLKTMGVAQTMAQFGMFVPAQKARLSLVDDVVFSIGDEQNEMNGLSSFASEIIKISDIVKRARRERLLVLIDEPARTTNPIEGKAIVQAICKLLQGTPHTVALITTHYNQLGLPCRRLRVRGFVEDMADVALSPQNINCFMDYTLLPDDSDDVPQEALRIATILGCDEELLSVAKNLL